MGDRWFDAKGLQRLREIGDARRTLPPVWLRSCAVTYFCFIVSTILSVPHMEPLTAEELEDARREAEALLDQHASGYAAHVFDDDERVATLLRPERTQDTQHPPVF